MQGRPIANGHAQGAGASKLLIEVDLAPIQAEGSENGGNYSINFFGGTMGDRSNIIAAVSPI